MLETCPDYTKISQPTPPLCPTLQGQFPRSRTCSSPSTASPWRGTLSPFIPAQLEAIRGREERTYLLIEDEDLSYDGDPRVVRALLGREFAEVGLLVIFLSCKKVDESHKAGPGRRCLLRYKETHTVS